MTAAAPKSYAITVKSAMQWATSELEHVGRIAAVMDPDIQYAYAMSTLNGMAHLKDALYELVQDPNYATHRADLQKTHDAVVRTMRHLKTTYKLDLDAIRAFNTRGTLSDLAYLEESPVEAEAADAPLEYTNYVPAEDQEAYASKDVVPQDGGRRRRRTLKRRSKKFTYRNRMLRSRRH